MYRLVKKDVTVPFIPLCLSLCKSSLRGTVSKVLEKSRIITFDCSPWPFVFKKSLRVTRSCVSHENPDLKPWFNFLKTLFFSRWFNKCLQIICSSNFHDIDISETGR